MGGPQARSSERSELNSMIAPWLQVRIIPVAMNVEIEPFLMMLTPS